MRLLALICLALLLSVGAIADAQIVQFSGAAVSAPPGCTPNGQDGSGSPATGTAIQYPTILNGYATRPAWCVAGVDYAVGIPAAKVATLKDPATISMSGVTVFGSFGQIEVNGANVTLDNYDFSLTPSGGQGNWMIVPTDAADNLVVTNSKFKVGASGGQKAFAYNGTSTGFNGLTIEYCDFDGNNGADYGSVQAIVEGILHGTVIMEYNNFKNVGSTFVQIQQDSNGPQIAWTMKYNILYNSGISTQDIYHNDITYSSTPVTTNFSALVFDYNLVTQTTWGQNMAPGGQGVLVAGTTTISASHNTVIASATNGNLTQIFQMWTEDNTTSIGSQVGLSTNYVDASGWGATGAGSHPSFFINKLNPTGAVTNSLPATGNTDMNTNTQPGAWNGLLFVLRRDLGYANDNTPMWLNEVS